MYIVEILLRGVKGFTLIEFLVVIVIFAVLISLTVPLGMDFYRNQQIDAQSQGVLQVLRQAQLKARSGEMDSSFGVYLTNDSYTLFKGASYDSRDLPYDRVFALPTIIRVSGLGEVVFSKLEGKPNVTGDIVLSSGKDSQTINVNEVGRINLEL